MLSRVAEALFWVGRYVERAEDTARLLDVHFHEVLEDPGVDEAHACAVLLAVMGVPDDTADKHRDSRAVLELLGYNEDSSSSIVGALSAAWQNARSAREALSADIWECLNSTHNSLQTRVAAARDFGPTPFFSYVRERAANVAGYVEASMSRDTSYDALVLGRSLERVDMTARLLAARIGSERASEGWTSPFGPAPPTTLTCVPTSRASMNPGSWNSCWWTGSSPARSSTRSGPGSGRWPSSTRRPGARGWMNPPAGRSAGRAPTWSSFPPPSSSTDCRTGCSDCSGPCR
jgi:A predicted alpha-helical domain with a conserved ER motif.